MRYARWRAYRRWLRGTFVSSPTHIEYVQELIQTAATHGGDEVFSHMHRHRKMFAKMKNLADQDVKGIGFTLNDEGFANLNWLDKRVHEIEKTLIEGNPLPSTPATSAPNVLKENGKMALLTLCEQFPPLHEAEIFPRLSTFLRKADPFDGDKKTLLVSVYDGSYIVFDTENKRVLPFRAPKSRAGVAENVASILVNNIGWTDNPETGEWFGWASTFIDGTRKCSANGPTLSKINSLLQKTKPSRPQPPTTPEKGPKAKHG
ncbi:MAG TPA: hypothetical protein DD400_03010 [Rhodospirillaceae bacterium]|nr:hypothetical protein [Rhodospirillaceae bacterium]